MRRIRRALLNIFSMVTTGSLIMVGVFTTIINPIERIESAIVWQILLVSGLCTLTSLIWPWNRKPGRTENLVRTVIQYVMVTVIVLGGGLLFEWYDPSKLHNMIAMLLSIAVIFGVVSAISWGRSAKDAAKMNEKLTEYQRRTEGLEEVEETAEETLK